MNVASLELCKELYELSGWETGENLDWYHGVTEPFRGRGTGYIRFCPAYDLGYLLRKLPHPMTGELLIHKLVDSYSAVWQPKGYAKRQRFWANTPEDAACKLAIELFKQGVLKRGEE